MSFPERIIEAISPTGFVLKKISGLEIQRSLLWIHLGHLVPLAVGEVLAGLCNFAILVFVSRYFGAGILGIYALGQTVAQYTMLGMDLGLKSIGARLVAMSHAHAPLVIHQIQIKRILLAVFFIPLALLYALWGPIPLEARLLVALFALSTAPYAVAHDWLLWGMERFVLLGAWRVAVAMLSLALVVAGVFLAHGNIAAVPIANGIGVSVGALWLWGFWELRLRRDLKEHPAADIDRVGRELSWRNAGWLGLAVVFYQIFQTVNILLLGAYSTPVQVGLYNASYKLVFLIVMLFSLVTQAMFPLLAKLADDILARKRILGLAYLFFLLGVGIILPGLFLSGKVIEILYGEQFAEAAQVMRILLLTIPFAFFFAFLGTVLTAWGMFRRTLAVTAIAALLSAAMNLYLIPHFGALGAAWAMVVSYCVISGVMLRVFQSGSTDPRFWGRRKAEQR